MGDVVRALVLTIAEKSVLRTLAAPIERALIVLQTQSELLSGVAPESAFYRDVPDVISRLPREEGEGALASLWRGNMTAVIATIPYSLSELAFASCKQMLTTKSQHLLGHFLAKSLNAVLFGSTVLAFTYPLERVRIKQAAEVSRENERKYADPFSTLVQLFNEEGICGLYKGLELSLLGIAASRMLFLSIYHFVGPLIVADPQKEPLKALIVAQAVSLTISGLISHPLQLIQRR